MDDIDQERRLYKNAHADKYVKVRHFSALHAPVIGSRSLAVPQVLVVQEDPHEYPAVLQSPSKKQVTSRVHMKTSTVSFYVTVVMKMIVILS